MEISSGPQSPSASGEGTSLRQSPAAVALHALSAFNFVEPPVVEAFVASGNRGRRVSDRGRHQPRKDDLRRFGH
jgi:hypothetical protein